MEVRLGILPGKLLNCVWYNPRDGKFLKLGKIQNKGVKSFNPPGEEKAGNDWVLILES